MFIGNLFEGSAKQVKVIYPGRFSPPHKGHAQVYNHLCQKFGEDNVYIVTSDKVAPPKSPFNFAEKQKMWALTGVNTDRVLMDPQPYRAEKVVAQWDPTSTILLFAVSEKDMAEDPRFQFKPKKDGSPSYFQQFTNLKQCQTLDKHAYMMTVPTFDFTVLGQPANSATQIRAQFADADLATQRKIVTDLFGKFDNNVFNIMKARLEVGEPVTEGNEEVDVTAAIEHFRKARHYEEIGEYQLADKHFAKSDKIMGKFNWHPETEVAEDDDSDIIKNISTTTGRTHEEAQRIVRAARRRAMQQSKLIGSNMSEPAWGNTIAHQIALSPKGKEVFLTGESVNEGIPTGSEEDIRRKMIKFISTHSNFNRNELQQLPNNVLMAEYKKCQKWRKEFATKRSEWLDEPDSVRKAQLERELQAMYDPDQGSLKFEDRATPNKPPKKGSQRWLSTQKRKEYDKKHPPVEPADQMYGTAKILPKDTNKSIDYSKFSTEALKWTLNSDTNNTLILEELKKRGAAQIDELSPATHASHIAKRSPQVIPALMKDVKKGAKMGRAVGKSMEKVKAFNKKSDEPNVFEETNSQEMARLQRELKKATDPNKKEAIRLNIRKLKGEMELRAKGKVTEQNNYNPQDTVTFDIPLLIRMLEFSREDAKSDIDLHNVVEKLIQMSTDGKTLTMAQYNSIVSQEMHEAIENFKQSLNESAQEDLLNPNPKIASLAAAVVRMKKELHNLTSGGNSIQESVGSDDAQDILEKLTDSYQAITRSDAYSLRGKDTIRTIYGLLRDPLMSGDMDEFSKMWDYCMRKWPDEFDELAADAATVYVGDEVIDETIVPGFGEMRPEQVKKEVEGLTAEMLKYARDGNMSAVAEYIKKLQPFVDTARKGEITESIDKALRTAKRNAI